MVVGGPESGVRTDAVGSVLVPDEQSEGRERDNSRGTGRCSDERNPERRNDQETIGGEVSSTETIAGGATTGVATMYLVVLIK